MKLFKDRYITWIKHLEIKYIPGSNIVYLITEALAETKRKIKPIGWESFPQSVAATNILISFFTKASTIKDIHQYCYEWQMF